MRPDTKTETQTEKLSWPPFCRQISKKSFTISAFMFRQKEKRKKEGKKGTKKPGCHSFSFFVRKYLFPPVSLSLSLFLFTFFLNLVPFNSNLYIFSCLLRARAFFGLNTSALSPCVRVCVCVPLVLFALKLLGCFCCYRRITCSPLFLFWTALFFLFPCLVRVTEERKKTERR